jgi:LmbE family N-acetylglucosaminyl deacetylase
MAPAQDGACMTDARPDPAADPTANPPVGQQFRFAGLHALFIVAHADDEVLAAGAHLGAFAKVSMIHTTDGAANRRAAQAHGFATRIEFAQARRAELHAALAADGVAAECHELGIRCEDASYRLAAITRRLARLIGRIAPDLIFTQVYEGGHVDHDATAFAVHAALRRLPAPPPLWELTGYHREQGHREQGHREQGHREQGYREDGHREPGQIERGKFPSAGGAPTVCLPLGPEARARKRRMLDAFRSQLDVVAQFPIDTEIFRPAPEYDFIQPPHAGALGYDSEGFGIDPHLWRALVLVAERQLRPGLGAWLCSRWLDLKLWWLIWTRRAHPDHPRLVRLMRSCRVLSDLDPSPGPGPRRHPGAPR